MTEIEKIIYEKLSEQFILFFAKIVSFNGHVASVAPLYKNSDGDNFAVVDGCPVMNRAGGVSYKYVEGDVVLCASVKTDLSQAGGEYVEHNNILNTHSLANTLVVGGFKQVAPTDGLRLQYGNNSIEISEDKIVLSGAVEIKNDIVLKENMIVESGDIGFGMGDLSALEATMQTYKTHVHGGVTSGGDKTDEPFAPP